MRILLGLLLAPVLLGAASSQSATAPTLSAAIPEAVLAGALHAPSHPRLFVSRDDVAAGRRNVRETPWGRAYLARQKAAAARFLRLDDAALRALVPPPHSLFVYGLGMNLDPVKKRRMTWAGWGDPFAMRDVDGKRYPNADWPDTGAGVVDPQSGERFYFVAQAHGRIMQAIEQTILPALAELHALDDSKPAAHAAAVLLDAIAAVYPTNRRGPLDYPTASGDLDRGGRLDRPYYQTARGLANYGFAIDLVAASGELEQASAYGPFSQREHIARNILWEGGAYCHDYAVRGYQLHNGHADYLRGAALAGVLLGHRPLADPMITGPLSLPAMLDVNIDRNGFYYETSPGYASHNRELYLDMAETMLAMRRLGWSGVPDIYAHPNLQLYLTAPFNRQEVGGHVPAIGDGGPDRSTHDPMRRVPAAPRVFSDDFIEAQLEAAWVQLVRGDGTARARAAELLADCFGSDHAPDPTARRWTVFHVSPADIARVKATPPSPGRLATASVVHGAKGLALLRGGEGRQRHGAQLFFGPGHNHSQRESLTWTFFSRGAEWSYAPGYFNKHYRASWVTQTVSHLSLVVNQRSHPWENGTAHLTAWNDASDVQWAMAAHPNLYDDLGVTRFERLIAQVHNAATGEPAYWLDLARVEGGETRDDSFHTQMKSLATTASLSAVDPRRPSLSGARDLGAAVLASDYIAGFDAKNFYLATPGAGYDFLGSPREAPLEEPLRVTLSDPLFATTLPSARIVIDYLGAPGRRLIVAQGGAPFGTARVPYLLQRDSGLGGRSAFAKVIRLTDDASVDPVSSIERAALDPAAPPAAMAMTVKWRDGRRDLWIVGDGSAVTARAAGLPAVETDAQVALVEFSAEGKARRVHASGARVLRVAGGPQLESPGVVRGEVVSVGIDAPTLRVRWDDGAPPPATAAIAVTSPPFGPSTTWSLARATANTATMADATLALAQSELRPVPGKRGEFTFASGISRFYSGGTRANTRYAIGKAVYAGETLIGRVRAIEGANQVVTLEGPGVASLRGPTAVRVLEVAAGDRIAVPVNLAWASRP